MEQKRQDERCFYRISIKALILNETRDKFLLFQEDNGKWEFPGGGLDFGESPSDCLTRELLEEGGLVVTAVSPKPAYLLTAKSDTRNCWVAAIFYETKIKDLNFTKSDECQNIKFVSKEELLDLDLFSGTAEFSKIFIPG
jgi:8-oxo-dGTP pyrophosphatase MutT (NUDIX family)